MGGGRLIDRVRGAQGRSSGGGASPESLKQFKLELQREILESIDFEQVSGVAREELAQRLRVTLAERIEANKELPLNRMERERLVEEILDDILGLGPLEPLLRDPDISDIMINGPKTIFIERKGKSSARTFSFRTTSIC